MPRICAHCLVSLLFPQIGSVVCVVIQDYVTTAGTYPTMLLRFASLGHCLLQGERLGFPLQRMPSPRPSLKRQLRRP